MMKSVRVIDFFLLCRLPVMKAFARFERPFVSCWKVTSKGSEGFPRRFPIRQEFNELFPGSAELFVSFCSPELNSLEALALSTATDGFENFGWADSC